MSRAKATTVEENVEKKAPRKRAAPKKKVAVKKAPATKAAPKKTTAKKAPTKRKVAAKKVAKKKVAEEVEKEEVIQEVAVVEEQTVATKKRKAPTVFASDAAKKRAAKTQIAVVCVLMVMGIGASAAVGFTDLEAGKINVEETIKVQNARMANMVDVDGPTVVAPAPNRATIPDSGFIASADQSTRAVSQPPVTDSAPSTASSSVAVATSTDAGVGEGQLNAESALLNPGEASAVDTATTTVTAADQKDGPETPPDSDDSIEQIE